MKKKRDWIYSIYGMAFSAFIIALGCGPDDPFPPLPPIGGVNQFLFDPTVCGIGQTKIAGFCYPTPDFTTACAWSNGSLISLSGVTVCRTKVIFNYAQGKGAVNFPFTGFWSYSSTQNMLPLNQSSPQSFVAYDLGMFVRKGDKVDFAGTGAWGYWAEDSYSSLTPDYLNYSWNLKCADVDTLGRGVLGGVRSQLTYNAMNAGLSLSDGTEVFYVGSSASRTIKNDGRLFIGFNAPDNAGCSSYKITKLELTRCQDPAGNSYTCP